MKPTSYSSYQSCRQALLFSVKREQISDLLFESLSLLLQPPHFAGHDHHFPRELFFELFDVIWVASRSFIFIRFLFPPGFGV